ncbi:MAG: hypothetical protein ACYC9Y_01910 [Candidatus Methylomirabilia bacterium]
MKAAWRDADRASELLVAARGWRAAGLIKETTFDTISAEHASAGPRLGELWRVLVFLCVFVGVSTATTIGFISFGVRSAGGVGLSLLVFGAALAAITDIVVDRCSFQPTGAEAATSLLATGYLCAAVFVLLDDRHLHGHEVLRLTYPWCAAVCALAAWRWGFRIYAGVAALCVLLLAAQFPGARPLWVAAAALIAGWATVTRATRELTPSHREGVDLSRLVALAAIYAAVNYYSVDKGFLEEIGRLAGAPPHRSGEFSLLLAGLGSALYPLAILAWGLRARDRALIVLGIVTAALSLTTIRFYIHVAPLWAVLAASGAALAGTSLLLERWLGSGVDAERFGFTAAPLCDIGRRERLLPAAAALALAPAARMVPDGQPDSGSKGGAFGGGGADGSF